MHTGTFSRLPSPPPHGYAGPNVHTLMVLGLTRMHLGLVSHDIPIAVNSILRRAFYHVNLDRSLTGTGVVTSHIR